MARGRDPKIYQLSVTYGTDYSLNVADVYTDHGRLAKFTQITNLGSSAVRCRLNGDDDAILPIDSGDTQVFNYGDILVSKLEFENLVSGGSDTSIQIIFGI